MELSIENDIQISGDAVNEGGTASIFRGFLKSAKLISSYGPIPIAIKIIKVEASNESEQRESFLYEIAIMSSLPQKTPYLITFIGYCNSPMTIVMKYHPCNIKELITAQKEGVDYSICLKMCHDISAGMHHLHASGIIHLDLKPRKFCVYRLKTINALCPYLDNVLIDLKSDRSFNCVICDFGFANFINESGSDRTVASGLRVPKTNGISVRYAAPEVSFCTRPIA